jgi:hypothetical protein
MKFFKASVSLILIFCTLLTLISCSSLGAGSSIDDVFSQLIVDESDAPAFADRVYVIIPSGCAGELSLKARELADGIEAKTGILTSLKYDNELVIVPQNSCEILIGNTNRLISDNALDVLRNGEYLCRWEDGAVVICGRSDASTIVAVDRFITEILPISSKYSLMPDEAHFENMKEYEIKRITLDGYDLYDYAITYPEDGTHGEKNAAFVIRDFISEKSGYFLDVISEKNIIAGVGKIISLRKGEENSICRIENGIAISGVDTYSIWLSAKKFMDDISKEADGGIIELEYALKSELEFIDTAFESTFCFLKKNTDEPFKPNYELISLLRSESLDICFIGNPNENLDADLDLNSIEALGYSEILIGDKKIAVAYNKSRVKSFNISVDADGRYMIADVKTAFGEEISYIYIIKDISYKDLPKNKNNTVLFCEGCEVSELEGIYSASEGEFYSANGKSGYYLANDLNLRIENSKIENNTQNLFYCVLKTKVERPEILSEYALEG